MDIFKIGSVVEHTAGTVIKITGQSKSRPDLFEGEVIKKGTEKWCSRYVGEHRTDWYKDGGWSLVSKKEARAIELQSNYDKRKRDLIDQIDLSELSIPELMLIKEMGKTNYEISISLSKKGELRDVNIHKI